METGRYIEVTRIKKDAIPVDDITKFAYNDDDYEVVQEWHEYTDYELQMLALGEEEERKRELLEVLEKTSKSQDIAICELYELIVGEE